MRYRKFADKQANKESKKETVNNICPACLSACENNNETTAWFMGPFTPASQEPDPSYSTPPGDHIGLTIQRVVEEIPFTHSLWDTKIGHIQIAAFSVR